MFVVVVVVVVSEPCLTQQHRPLTHDVQTIAGLQICNPVYFSPVSGVRERVKIACNNVGYSDGVCTIDCK